MFKDALETTGKGWINSPKFSKLFSRYKRLRKLAVYQYAMTTDRVGWYVLAVTITGKFKCGFLDWSWM